MTEAERRKLETSLIVSGFSGLNDPDLLPEMAKLISNHEILRALLNDCSILERGAMLDALRPHLPFEAHPVDWYETKTAEKFEDYERQRQRIIAGDKEFEQVEQTLATHLVITLKCHKCQASENYAGETYLGAVVLARQDGWVRERVMNKEVCPKCECIDRGKRKKCPGCTRRHYAPSCRILASGKRIIEQAVN